MKQPPGDPAAGLVLEQFSGSRGVLRAAGGGFFLRKEPLSGLGLSLQKLENRYRLENFQFRLREIRLARWSGSKLLELPAAGRGMQCSFDWMAVA
jgi:hypothetical protein